MGIELPDIPGNSNSIRDKKPEEKIEVKPLELRGSVEVKKKGLLTRIAGEFLPEDMELTKENIWKNVVKPSIKDLIFNAFEEFLFPSGRPGRNRNNSYDKPSYVNYVDYSRKNDNRDQRDRQQSRGSERDFDYRCICFADAEDASDCLRDLLGMLDRYPSVSIGNLYDILRRPTTDAQFNYGWTSLRDAKVVQERNGAATLYLPKASPLD